MPANNIVRSEEIEQLFLGRLADTGNIRKSAKLAGIDPTTVYRWYDSDSTFAAKWESAIQTYRRTFINLCEIDSHKCALSTTEPILYKGMDTGFTRRKFNAGLQMFYLKNLMPNIYKETDLSLNNNGDPLILARTLYNNLRASGEDHASASETLLKLGVAGQHIPPGEEDKEEDI